MKTQIKFLIKVILLIAITTFINFNPIYAQNKSCIEKAKKERVDGCSVSGLYGKLFEEACDQHDLCYSATNNSKSDCDDEFRAYMYELCDNRLVDKIACKAAADIYYAAVVRGGGDGYDWGQEWNKDESKGNCHLKKLNVKIATSNISGAGTNAKVEIRVYSDKGYYTAWHKLNTYNLNDHEKGRTYDYVIFPDIKQGGKFVLKNPPNFGKINKVAIRHDDSGSGGSGWHLDYVIVNGRSFKFDRWLHDDNLEASVEYKGGFFPLDIEVRTTDIDGANTDANVYIRVYSDKGYYTAWHELDDGGNDDFEKGNTDKFTILPRIKHDGKASNIKSTDFGKINKVAIKHDNSGSGGPGWHLDKVKANGKLFIFDQWLEDGHLQATEKYTAPKKRLNLIVKVKTGSHKNAGTKGFAAIRIYSHDNYYTNWYDLKDDKPYEKGKVATYELNAKIKKEGKDASVYPKEWKPYYVKLELKGEKNDGWYVEEVTIDGKTFYCNTWLDGDAGDNKIECACWPIKNFKGILK